MLRFTLCGLDFSLCPAHRRLSVNSCLINFILSEGGNLQRKRKAMLFFRSSLFGLRLLALHKSKVSSGSITSHSQLINT